MSNRVKKDTREKVMANSDNKKHNTQIIESKRDTSDLGNDQLDLIERVLNPIFPTVSQCLLARCIHFIECWDVGAKWKGGILGCKSPDKLKESHNEKEHVSFSKASKICYFNEQDIDIMIKAGRIFCARDYLPMYRTTIEELIKKLEDCGGIIGID